MEEAKKLDTIAKINERIRLKEEKPGTITTSDLELLYEFASKLTSKEYFGGFVHAVILFGSVARSEEVEGSDLDVLVLVDDLTIPITQGLLSTYRVGVGDLLVKLNAQDKIHLTTLGLLQFWDGVRNGDPIILTILRDGKPIVDTGFFKPLQKLLEYGMIKPTPESIDAHAKMARSLLIASDNHLLAAMADLYWSIIDATHAILMKEGILPTYPAETPKYIAKLVKKKKSAKKHLKTLKDMIKIMKGITHRKILRISGKKYDSYRKRVEEYVKKVNSLIS